jgi:MFS family permease
MIGLGAIVGASYVAWSGRRWRGALLIAGAMASGLGLALVGTVPVLAVAVGLTIMVGIGDALRRALNQALLLESANAEYRGRVVSIYAMNFGLTPAGALPAGALAEVLGEVPPWQRMVDAMGWGFAREFGGSWARGEMTPEEAAMAAKLETRYGSGQWTWRR